MEVTADELAGVVALFGGLTRTELRRALAEAAFRADGGTVDEDALERTIKDALTSFALVEDESADPLLVAGPTAFPVLPDGAEDLPHILDVDRREIDRAALGEHVLAQFRRAVDDAVAADAATAGGGTEPIDDRGDGDRVHRLLDTSYDLEAWADVDASAERARLESAAAEVES